MPFFLTRCASVLLSATADNQKMVTETKLIDTLHKVIEEFRADPGVIWRASVCVRNIAALGRKLTVSCILV